MSEVKRWKLKGFLPGVEGECKAVFQPTVVMAEDFDNATRLFLDAAERCVATERREKELQRRLTAADERADEDDMVLRSSVPERHKGCTSPVGAVQSYIVELEGRADLLEALLLDARQYYGVTLLTDPPQDAWKYHRISERIDAALKQTEGGGDEYRKSCEAASKALSMENQRITPVQTETREDSRERLFGRFGDGE